MSIIKIRRSGSSGSPSELAQGELAYSYLGGTQSNGGDRLYIGTGTETAGVAANIEVIGGKYFTEKLDHVPGVLTSNSALIVDAGGKIDILNVDNITINDNEISSTNTNGNITLNPNGSGAIDASSAQIINLANPTSAQHAVTVNYLESTFSANLSIAGDSGTDTITLLSETLVFSGDTGITTTVSANTVTIDLDDTTVTPGSYGNTTAIATFTVDQQGRLTSAGTANIATTLTINADLGTPDTVDLIGDALTFTGNTGITTTVGSNSIDIDLDDTSVVAGTYGSATETTTFVVDQQGRLTSAEANTISIPHTQVNDWAEAVQDTVGGMLIGTQNGIAVTYTDNGVGGGYLNFDVSDPTITIAGDVAGFATMTNLGNVTITVAQQNDSVDLGTHTTGDYVASLVAGTGVTLQNNSGETATPTISIGQDVSTTANVEFNYGVFTGNLQIDGDFVVGGTTSTISAQNLAVSDNMIYMNQGISVSVTNAVGDGANVVYTTETNNYANGMTVAVSGMDPSSFDVVSATILVANSTSFTIASAVTDTFVSGGTARAKASTNPDLGWAAGYYDGGYAHTGFFRDASDGYFKPFKGYTPEPDEDVFIDTSHASFALADIQAANFRGALVGNADTTTKWLTARTITLAGDLGGNVTIDGTANVTLTATIQADSVALGTDTTGNYASDVAVSGNGLSITGSAGENVSYTVQSNATSTESPSTIVFRDSNRNFSANTITAALVGNATTATTLQTSRTIALSGDVVGSVSFNGSGDVSISTTIQADSVALGTDTTGNYVQSVGVTAGTGLSVTGTGEGATVTLAGVNATTSTKGVASFDSSNFTVTSGAVAISAIDGGTY
jgi:cytoskeletal protein CcmA (bactofilin family)